MKNRRQNAFSLVEVVLALGIVAFALTAMFGLLALAMQSHKSSASDTALAAISRQVFNDLRAKPYADLSDPLSPTGGKQFDFYFDVDGAPCLQAGAVYRCQAVLTDDPEVATGNLKRVQMTFTWPPAAVKPETKIIHGNIANHGP